MRSKAWAGDWPITQDWGFTDLDLEPWYQGRHWHCGIDIGMPVGTVLYAVRAGVVKVRTFGILGIQTPSGQVDYYIHGDYSVLLGRSVVKGAVLGTSGARVPGGGSLTGPHLHFEIQDGLGLLNQPTGLDPLPILSPGLFSSPGATLSGDMTPEQDKLLSAIGASTAIRNPVTQAQVRQIVAEALAAQPPSAGGAVDLQPLMDELRAMRAVVDKIDRGD